MKPFLTFLALASLLLFGCEPEGQDIAFEVNVTQWANPDFPEVGATVVLEEQRLTNGVLNSFLHGNRTRHHLRERSCGIADGPKQRACVADSG